MKKDVSSASIDTEQEWFVIIEPCNNTEIAVASYQHFILGLDIHTQHTITTHTTSNYVQYTTLIHKEAET